MLFRSGLRSPIAFDRLVHGWGNAHHVPRGPLGPELHGEGANHPIGLAIRCASLTADVCVLLRINRQSTRTPRISLVGSRCTRSKRRVGPPSVSPSYQSVLDAAAKDIHDSGRLDFKPRNRRVYRRQAQALIEGFEPVTLGSEVSPAQLLRRGSKSMHVHPQA